VPGPTRKHRRQQERELKKEIRERQRLALSGPGGAPDRPLTVASAAVIEGRARSTPCIQCAGELDLREHAAELVDGRSLRRVDLRCRRCDAPRQLWFCIVTPLLS
jgi:hypothetical protein